MTKPKQNRRGRQDWQDFWLSLAEAYAARSTCPRLRVGAIITHNNRLVGTGYNGAPHGMEHCLDKGCIVVNDHCVRTIHAEINAISQVDRALIQETPTLDNALNLLTCWSTHQPCLRCILTLYQNGVRQFFWTHSTGNLDELYDLLSQMINKFAIFTNSLLFHQ